jgi:hypothetical protein
VEIAPERILEWQKLPCYNRIMQRTPCSVTHLTDEQLLTEVKRLAHREREATVGLIASLAELDARQPYLGEGFPSLFAYCTQCLHLSEHAAYSRIAAARAARKWPVILDLLADGSVTLTTVVLVAPHLTSENHQSVLGAAKHRSRREVEQQVAALRPLPAVPSIVRKVPATKAAVPQPLIAASEPPLPSTLNNRSEVQLTSVPCAPSPPVRPSVVAALAPELFKVQVTISRETHDKLRRVQDLLRHSVPSGDPAEIFDRALTVLLADLERKKLAQTRRPRPAQDSTPGSRHVPAAVRREVWKRDEGRCAFVGTTGRCAERGFLEFHHVVPFAEGGETTSGNLQLRCRAHNLYEAKEVGLWFFRELEVGYGLGPNRVSRVPPVLARPCAG